MNPRPAFSCFVVGSGSPRIRNLPPGEHTWDLVIKKIASNLVSYSIDSVAPFYSLSPEAWKAERREDSSEDASGMDCEEDSSPEMD